MRFWWAVGAACTSIKRTGVLRTRVSQREHGQGGFEAHGQSEADEPSQQRVYTARGRRDGHR